MVKYDEICILYTAVRMVYVTILPYQIYGSIIVGNYYIQLIVMVGSIVVYGL